MLVAISICCASGFHFSFLSFCACLCSCVFCFGCFVVCVFLFFSRVVLFCFFVVTTSFFDVDFFANFSIQFPNAVKLHTHTNRKKQLKNRTQIQHISAVWLSTVAWGTSNVKMFWFVFAVCVSVCAVVCLVVYLLLIPIPSFNWAPDTPVFDTRSLPANCTTTNTGANNDGAF